MAGQFKSEQVDSIIVQTLLDSSDDTVDLWVQDVHKIMQASTKGNPVRLLVDLGQPNIVFTEYARQTSGELFTHYKHHIGKFALLFEWKTGPHIARIFIASLGNITLEINFFNDKEDALQWLQGEVDS